MIFFHIGGGAGDLDPSTNFRDGFSEFVKSHKSKNKKIYIIEANPVNINKLKNQSSTTGSNLNGDIFDAKLKLRDFQDSLKTIISKKNLTQTEVKVLSLREIQQNLSPNTAVLTYLWNFNPNKRTDADLQSQFGMVISKNTIQSFKIESNQGVHALINNFKNQMNEFEAIKPGVTGDFFKENDVHDLCLSISKFINITNEERELLRSKVFEVIDIDYNPRNQIEILKKEII